MSIANGNDLETNDDQLEQKETDSCRLENCSLSQIGKCHQPFKRGSTELRVPSAREKYLLSLRTNVPSDSIQNICHHHSNILLTAYSIFKHKCCNPFKLHNKLIKKSLKVINENLYEDIKEVAPSAIPGDKICIRCSIHASNLRGKPGRTKPPRDLDLTCEPAVDPLPVRSSKTMANYMIKRKRSARFTEQEVEALVSAVLKRKQDLLGPGCTIRQKELGWKAVTCCVNEVGDQLRSSKEVKKKWFDMKSRIKSKYMCASREDRRKGIEQKLSVYLSNTEERIFKVEEESDAEYAAESQVMLDSSAGANGLDTKQEKSGTPLAYLSPVILSVSSLQNGIDLGESETITSDFTTAERHEDEADCREAPNPESARDAVLQSLQQQTKAFRDIFKELKLIRQLKEEEIVLRREKLTFLKSQK